MKNLKAYDISHLNIEICEADDTIVIIECPEHRDRKLILKEKAALDFVSLFDDFLEIANGKETES